MEWHDRLASVLDDLHEFADYYLKIGPRGGKQYVHERTGKVRYSAPKGMAGDAATVQGALEGTRKRDAAKAARAARATKAEAAAKPTAAAKPAAPVAVTPNPVAKTKPVAKPTAKPLYEMTPVEVARSDVGFSAWRNAVEDAFRNELIDENHPAWAGIRDVGRIKKLKESRSLQGRHVRTFNGHFGVATGIDDDGDLDVTLPSGEKLKVDPETSRDVLYEVRYDIERGKDPEGRDATYAAKIVADEAVKNNQNISDVMRGFGLDPVKGKKLRMMAAREVENNRGIESRRGDLSDLRKRAQEIAKKTQAIIPDDVGLAPEPRGSGASQAASPSSASPPASAPRDYIDRIQRVPAAQRMAEIQFRAAKSGMPFESRVINAIVNDPKVKLPGSDKYRERVTWMSLGGRVSESEAQGMRAFRANVVDAIKRGEVDPEHVANALERVDAQRYGAMRVDEFMDAIKGSHSFSDIDASHDEDDVLQFDWEPFVTKNGTVGARGIGAHAGRDPLYGDDAKKAFDSQNRGPSPGQSAEAWKFERMKAQRAASQETREIVRQRESLPDDPELASKVSQIRTSLAYDDAVSLIDGMPINDKLSLARFAKVPINAKTIRNLPDRLAFELRRAAQQTDNLHTFAWEPFTTSRGTIGARGTGEHAGKPNKYGAAAKKALESKSPGGSSDGSQPASGRESTKPKVAKPNDDGSQPASGRESTKPKVAKPNDVSDEIVDSVSGLGRENASTLSAMYRKIKAKFPEVTAGQFHDIVRDLWSSGRVRLDAHTQAYASISGDIGPIFLMAK